jgi:Family of unknown function (DUF6011)
MNQSKLTLLTIDDPIAPAASISNPNLTIKERLELAKSKGVLYPRMVFEGYKFTLAPATGRNVGAVYVMNRSDRTYYGKIIDNKLYPAYGLAETLAQEIQTILDNPVEAATVHGQQTGTCCCCGRTLFNANSIAAMIGPICAEKYGF